MTRSKKQQKRQELTVILIGIAIIGASVFTTLWFSGVLRGSEGRGGYQHVSFTDAALQCESQVRKMYEGRLLVLSLDDHSSRFDESYDLFRIFLKAQIKSARSESGVSDFLINCYVNAEHGKIATLDAYEQKESQTEAIRQDDGGIFGWPTKQK